MDLFRPPLRNLTIAVLYMIVVFVLATASYLAMGWSFADALYFVVVTIYTVGYDEVHPIVTPLARTVTIGTIVLGCTGMIYLTSSLVQFITINQLQLVLGSRRMQTQIEKLRDHVIVCGFGRIGQMLAQELAAGGTTFVVLERSEQRVEQTDEHSLKRAGVERARALATVLPDDAANVFITLSARNLNPNLEIIARGEAPSTEKKLRHAGADKVVLPAHIGAERIADMILYPEGAVPGRGKLAARNFERTLQSLGLQMEVLVAEAGGPIAGLTVGAIEQQAKGAFLVARVNRADHGIITSPGRDLQIQPGDGLVIVGRQGELAPFMRE
jgi:voltage-gated potassium channel Kch